MPFHGLRAPLNISGNFIGNITASYKDFLAFSNPEISSHLTFGFSVTIASCNAFLNLSFSLSLAFPPLYIKIIVPIINKIIMIKILVPSVNHSLWIVLLLFLSINICHILFYFFHFIIVILL